MSEYYIINLDGEYFSEYRMGKSPIWRFHREDGLAYDNLAEAKSMADTIATEYPDEDPDVYRVTEDFVYAGRAKLDATKEE